MFVNAGVKGDNLINCKVFFLSVPDMECRNFATTMKYTNRKRMKYKKLNCS